MLPNWIGDLAMATPTLRALRKHFADAELIGLVRPYAAVVLKGTNWLDTLIPWEHRGWRSTPGNMGMAWQVRKLRIDSFVLMRRSYSAAMVARASGARKILGYERFGRNWLLTDVLPLPRSNGKLLPVSAVDFYLNLAYELGCPTESRQLELHTTSQEEAAADVILKELKISKGQQAIMLNTGSAGSSARNWPLEHGAAFARRAATELGLHVLINCGPAERMAAEEMVKLANHRQVKSLAHLPPQLRGIGPSKAVIRRMQLMVSTDSGPRHLAAAFGVPTISLSGPIDPAWSHNYQPGGITLRVEMPCSPCGERVCPLKHHKCMQDLSVDQVFEAVRRRMAKVPSRIAA
ncbi:MAG: glycosyltransferase family 9 protein [Pirellulaceae bacterium]